MLPTPTAAEEPHGLPPDVDLMKFVIGLRILGAERQERYLSYLQKLRDTTQPKGEGQHDRTSI